MPILSVFITFTQIHDNAFAVSLISLRYVNRISVITVQIMRCVSRFMSLTTGCRPNQYKGLGWFGRGRGWWGVRNETHSAFTVVPLTLVPLWSTSLPFIWNRNINIIFRVDSVISPRKLLY